MMVAWGYILAAFTAVVALLALVGLLDACNLAVV
jgi:hypothetical protein